MNNVKKNQIFHQVLFFLVGVIFFIPSNLFAWNFIGHEIIAQIAYDNLKPAARRQVNYLVKQLSKEHSQYKTFVMIAPWADTLRNDDVTAFDDWHFINMSFSPDGSPAIPLNKENVAWAIQQCIQVLQSSHASTLEKALFLRFLVHFVGDIHQPLHCATRVTKEFPQGDKGGNLFPIQYDNMTSLHELWDDGVGLFNHYCSYHRVTARCIRAAAYEVQLHYPPAFFKRQLKDENPYDWAQESFSIAKNEAYQLEPNSRPNLQYLRQGQKVSEKQIGLAGYRLAMILNNIFASKR